MNTVDILVILFLASIFLIWVYFKKKNSKNKQKSKCHGCAMSNLCNKNKK